MKNFALLFTLALASTNLLAMEQEGLKRKAGEIEEQAPNKEQRREFSILNVPHAVIATHAILPIIYGTEDINEVFKTLRSAALTGELSKAITHPVVKEHLINRIERDVVRNKGLFSIVSNLSSDASAFDHALEFDNISFLKSYLPLARKFELPTFKLNVEKQIQAKLLDMGFEDKKMSELLSILLKNKAIDLTAILDLIPADHMSDILRTKKETAKIITENMSDIIFVLTYNWLNLRGYAQRLLQYLTCRKSQELHATLSYDKYDQLRAAIRKNHACTHECNF